MQTNRCGLCGREIDLRPALSKSRCRILPDHHHIRSPSSAASTGSLLLVLRPQRCTAGHLEDSYLCEQYQLLAALRQHGVDHPGIPSLLIDHAISPLQLFHLQTNARSQHRKHPTLLFLHHHRRSSRPHRKRRRRRRSTRLPPSPPPSMDRARRTRTSSR